MAEELWNAHTKPFIFPFSSAATCTNRPLEVDQRRRPCERDGPIGHVLKSCCDSIPVTFLTRRARRRYLSACSDSPVAFFI
ncbi:hypothetical protein Taro_026479 [Colocasia esculenta]|uniref:Uncharacterized protein n=1 Tax=Colocasia esculenta TaxID=4460 RepID=A0A843VRE9_COLES|nr:hypothetical protein [Colocasia esculenta]